MNEQNIIDEIQSCFELKVNLKGLLFLEKQITDLEKENKRLKSLLENQSKVSVADHKYASLKEDEVIELKEQIRAVNRGLRKVMSKRDTWKNKYYNTKKNLIQSNSIIREAKEYIYKNSIPISLTSSPPIHKLDFRGDINEVLEILKKVED